MIFIEEVECFFFLGVDVGGIMIKIGFVDNIGCLVFVISFLIVDYLGFVNVVECVCGKVDEMLVNLGFLIGDLVVIGLGILGMYDFVKGMIFEFFNFFGWWNFFIWEVMCEVFDGFVVIYVNDVLVVIYGEYWVGMGWIYRSLVMLMLGIGVGGGIIVNDVLIDGEYSYGLECGYIVIDSSENVWLCLCG